MTRIVKDAAERTRLRQAYRDGIECAYSFLIDCKHNASATSLVAADWWEKACQAYPDPEPEYRTVTVDGLPYRFNPRTQVFEVKSPLSDEWQNSLTFTCDVVRDLHALLLRPRQEAK